MKEKAKSLPTAMPPLVRAGWILLLLAFGMQALVGYSVALAIDGPLWAWHQESVANALWGSAEYGPEVEAYRAWAMALLGGTIASWAVAMMWVVAVPMRRREGWAWWAVITSTMAWFWIDTAVSAAHGVMINVLFNLGALLMLAIPLAMTWSWRRDKTEVSR